MSKIKVYGIQSQHVAKVRAALMLKEIEFEHISVNLLNKSNKFKLLTPITKIPVLEDEDGTIVYDSQNISQYLDLKYSETYKLFSEDVKNQVKILNISAIANNIQEAVPPMVLEKFGIINKTDNPKFRFNVKVYTKEDEKEAMDFIKIRLEKLNELLENNNYFVENRITYADISVLALLPMIEFVGCDCKVLKKWSDNLMKNKVLSKMFAPKEEQGIKEI